MAKNTPSLTKKEVPEEFSRLFWLARKQHMRLKEEATTSNPDHLAALAFAKVHGWSWAESLLEASRLNKADEYDEALSSTCAVSE